MPEGDSVHKAARALSRRMAGRRIERLWLRDRGPVDSLAGAELREFAPLGKHLLVAVRPPASELGEYVIHVHLGMNGRWRRHRAGEPWSRPPWQAGLVLDVDGWRTVCFRPAVVELLRRSGVRAHPGLRRLGPDLLAPPVPFDRVVARARASESGIAAELLLDQRVACGIGNVYKNEVLFLHGVHPRTPVSALPDARLRALYTTAAEQMARNLGPGRRNTVRGPWRAFPTSIDSPRFWVHERAGLPCLRCGGTIEWERLGDSARPTYWCPSCQPAHQRSSAVAVAPGG